VVVTVALRRRRLRCPLCSFEISSAYDTWPFKSRWRHLDLGTWKLELRAGLRRLTCPEHGVRTEAVEFARPGGRQPRDLDDLIGYLATAMDKTAICRLLRVDWDTVGRCITRVMGERLDVNRLREGKDAETLDRFFEELGTKRAAQITAVSMDMGPAFEKSVRAEGHAPQAVICYDPVSRRATRHHGPRHGEARGLAGDATAGRDRRASGQGRALVPAQEPGKPERRAGGDPAQAERKGGALWRAYGLKEALRGIFAGDLDVAKVNLLLDRFCSRASRSGLKPFVTLAKTIRARREGILAAIRLGINNAQHEGINRRVRLIINRAYGFHSARAALALVMLSLGPITHVLPHERSDPQPAALPT
jgi:transposase